MTALEGDEEEIYEGQDATPEIEAIAADEREHAEIWRKLKDPDYHPDRDIATRERWHRSGRSGTLRAVIFGVSDGLVSNLALVMGVAGASGQTATPGHFILLAGIAGLLAGAFSMAAGEYISMQSQRELFERQIDLERAEMEAMPEEEEAEMASLYRAKGFREDEAKAIAHRLFEDPERALDQLIREELGLDPDELGLADRGGVRVVRRVRDRGVRAGPAVPDRERGGRVRGGDRAEPRRPLRRRRRGEPADRPERPVLRRPPGRDRGGGRDRDVRRRHA